MQGRTSRRIGLAIVGAGRIGLIRGVAETRADRGKEVATAAEAHNRLMLTKALDLSARRKRPVALPITPEDERA